MRAARSELAYFSPQFIESDIHREFIREITPVSAIQHGCSLEFDVQPSDLLAVDLSKSYLYVTIQLLKADDTKPEDSVEISTINLPAHTMFSQLDVELSGQKISDSNTLSGYRSMLETLLSYDKNVQETELQKSLWYKDTADHMKAFNTKGNTATNLGLKARAEYFKAGAEVELIGRPHGDIFNQPLAIPPKVPIKLRFVPAHDDFVIVTPAPEGNAAQVKYKVKIISAKMYIYTLELTPSVQLEITHHLQKQNIVIPLIRNTMKYLAISSAQTANLFEGVFRGQLPDRIVLGLVTDSAMTGGYQENPFNFQHFNLNYLTLNVNGENLPNRPFTPDFTNKKYLREYYSMFEGLEIQNSAKSINISRDEYAKGYTLFVFDLRSGPNSTGALAATKTGDVRLELKFSTATTTTINCLVYAEFNTFIEIDKHHNVITPF